MPVPDSVFSLVRVIGVGRPEFAGDLSVIFGPSVFVAHHHRQGSAERFPFKNARQNLASVFLFPLRREFALTRTTAIQFSLNVRFGNVDPRRAAVDHHADTAAMRFAKSGHAKELAEGVRHCGWKITILVISASRLLACSLRMGKTPIGRDKQDACPPIKLLRGQTLDRRLNRERLRRQPTGEPVNQ